MVEAARNDERSPGRRSASPESSHASRAAARLPGRCSLSPPDWYTSGGHPVDADPLVVRRRRAGGSGTGIAARDTARSGEF